jgi:hypothetical protein
MNGDGVFCILKYRVYLCKAYQTTEYAILELTHDGYDYSTTVIPAKKAKAIISEYGMKEKVNNVYGHVWELPRKSFKRRFMGRYRIRAVDL